MGRYKKYTNKRLKEIAVEINKYTDKPPNGIPTVAECAFLLGEFVGTYRRQFYYEHDDCDEFMDAVKRLTARKESLLELGALSGKLNPSMAIFSLKQMGWTDKHEHNLPGGKGGEGPSKVIIEWE